ncbi:MAG: ComEC/Rec2 family competence protein [Breznakibacter sp.]
MFKVLSLCLAGFLLLFYLIFLRSSLKSNYRYRWVPGVLVAMILVIFGVTWTKCNEVPAITNEGNCRYFGVVTEIAQNNVNSCRFNVRIDSLVGSSVKVAGPVNALFYAKNQAFDPDSIFGKTIVGNGFLMPFKQPDFPYQFNYGKYLHRKGFSFSFFVNDLRVVDNGPRLGWARHWMHDVRNKFVNVFRTGMRDVQLQGVVQALVIGDNSILDPELKYDYIESGVIHVLAVSGMHVGILFVLVSQMLFFLRRKKWLLIPCSIAFLWLYAWLTGFPPSVLRATIMFSVLLLGKEASKNASMCNILAFSGFIILLIDPFSLYDAGFWLSHLAVLGIGLFYRPINALFCFNFIGLRWIWSSVAVSIAAQITTFPVMLMLFNGFPIYFLLANLLVLPVVSTILIGALGLMLLPVDSFLFKMVAGVVADLVQFMNNSATWVASLPGAYIPNLSMTTFEVILFFISLLFIVNYVATRRFLEMALGITLGIFLLASLSYRMLAASTSTMLCVSVKPNKTFFNVMVGRQGYVLVENDNAMKQASMSVLGLWGKRFLRSQCVLGIDSLKNHQIRFGDSRCSVEVCPTVHMFKTKVGNNAAGPKTIFLCIENGHEAVCVHDAQGTRFWVLGKSSCRNAPKTYAGVSGSGPVRVETGCLVESYVR